MFYICWLLRFLLHDSLSAFSVCLSFTFFSDLKMIHSVYKCFVSYIVQLSPFIISLKCYSLYNKVIFFKKVFYLVKFIRSLPYELRFLSCLRSPLILKSQRIFLTLFFQNFTFNFYIWDFIWFDFCL